jgi:hypothetical protein
VQEAGGVANDFLGANGLLGRGPVLAANRPMLTLSEEVTGVALG